MPINDKTGKAKGMKEGPKNSQVYFCDDYHLWKGPNMFYNILQNFKEFFRFF